MVNVGSLRITFEAVTKPFDDAIKKTRRQIKSMKASFKTLGRALFSLKGAFAGVLSVAAVTKLTITVLKLAAANERLAVSYRQLIPDAQLAAKTFKEIKQFAAATPFQTTEVAKAGETLLRFGVGAESVKDTLARLGDFASGSSRSLGDVATFFGKIRSQGRLFQDDLNQFPILIDLLKTKFGLAGSEMRKFVEEGNVGFRDLVDVINEVTSAGGRFAGATEVQSQTIAGVWSTITSGIKESGAQIGEMLISMIGLKDVATDISLLLSSGKLSGLIKEQRDSVQAILSGFDAVITLITNLWRIIKFIVVGATNLVMRMVNAVESVFRSVKNAIGFILGMEDLERGDRKNEQIFDIKPVELNLTGSVLQEFKDKLANAASGLTPPGGASKKIAGGSGGRGRFLSPDTFVGPKTPVAPQTPFVGPRQPMLQIPKAQQKVAPQAFSAIQAGQGAGQFIRGANLQSETRGVTELRSIEKILMSIDSKTARGNEVKNWEGVF